MGSSLVQLPIYVVLTNSIAVVYFTDFLTSVGGQNLIDCFLAIEVFYFFVGIFQFLIMETISPFRNDPVLP